MTVKYKLGPEKVVAITRQIYDDREAKISAESDKIFDHFSVLSLLATKSNGATSYGAEPTLGGPKCCCRSEAADRQ